MGEHCVVAAGTMVRFHEVVPEKHTQSDIRSKNPSSLSFPYCGPLFFALYGSQRFRVAQMVEQLTVNQFVAGSSPAAGANPSTLNPSSGLQAFGNQIAARRKA